MKEAKMTEKEIEKIYNEGYRAVYWTAMSLLRNEADAEDVVQDTFVSFIESYGNMEDTTKATALLKKIAANKSLNRLKSARTENVDDEVMETLETVPENFLPDSMVESAEMRRIVMDIIEKYLSEDVRRTIILFYFNEMSTKEISEALGVPQGTVLWRLNFARKKIKKEVEKYEEESNTKLFAMPLPFLTQLFIKEAEQVQIKPMPASLLRLSASTEAASSEAGRQIASQAIKKGTGIMSKKIFIWGGAALAVAAVAGVIAINANKKSTKNDLKTKQDKTKVTTEETEEETSESIVGESTEESKANSTDIASSVVDETSAAPSSSDETTETTVYSKAGKSNPQGTVFISFEGKTADEVYEDLLEISYTPKDITLENYDERFVVYPDDIQYKQDSVNWVMYFWDLDMQTDSEGISQVDAHIVRKEDGTLDVSSRAEVSIIVRDRDRWNELYSAACDALMKLEGVNSLMKSGTSDDYESSIHMTHFVTKKMDEAGNYLLLIDIPLKDPDVEEEEKIELPGIADVTDAADGQTESEAQTESDGQTEPEEPTESQ